MYVTWVFTLKCTNTVVWFLVIFLTHGSQRSGRILEETLDIIPFMRVHCDTRDNNRGHHQIGVVLGNVFVQILFPKHLLVSVSRVHNSALCPFRRYCASDMWKHYIKPTWLLRVGTLMWLRVNASTQVAAGTYIHLASCSVPVQISAQTQECPWATMQNVPHEQLACTRVSKDTSDPSPQSYKKPLRSDSSALFLSLCVLCIWEQFSWNGLEFHCWKFLPGNFWFWSQKLFFFPQKIPYVAIFYWLGWLVGCDLVRLLGMYFGTAF